MSRARSLTRSGAASAPLTLAEPAIVTIALVGSVALASHGLGGLHHGWELTARTLAFAAGATLPLVAWRLAPLAVFVVSATVSTLAVAFGFVPDIPIGPTIALYLLAMSRTPARPWTAAMTAATAVLLVAYVAASGVVEAAVPWLAILHTGLAWAVAWFAGERTRLLREQMAELRERALEVERDADQERRVAVAEERVRIARDLHDSAGHAINVIAVRAGAARLRHSHDPDRSLAALEAIEEVARLTAADVDRIVHALREEDPNAPAPTEPSGLASLTTMVDQYEQAGLSVEVRSAGVPRRLDRSVDQAAYRILQEALTNAAKHGGGPVTIQLVFGDRELGLTVTNPTLHANDPGADIGHGLVGMRERATLLGGTLEAGQSDFTFRVHARLPFGDRPE